MEPTLRVKDADKVLRAFKKVERKLPVELVRKLRTLGREVEADARAKFMPINPAQTFKTSVSKTGRVRVGSAGRKTTGDHPEYGRAIMVRALLPALAENRSRVEEGIEQLVEDVIRENGLK